MCSIPQKQPAASVAFSAPSGMFMLPELASGAKRIVDEVKGLVRRWKMEVMVGRAMRVARKMRNLVVDFRFANRR